ncbi:MAG: glutathione S-transferase [Acidobacteria bacterium]|nr:MAG: glutathione S-transferase [Acidobacteriota bacterium]REK06895.1 MAG: glutathione S-transferase [Acidobacteriota bacterium]
MITVHHLVVGRSLFTVWLLEELGVDYALEIYHRLETGRAPASLRQVHALGKSPVIDDDGVVVHESGAIAAYLLDRYDPEHRLAPRRDDPRWPRFVQWLHYPEGSAFAPLLFHLLAMRSGEPAGDSTRAFAAAEAALHLGYIRDALVDQDWVLGEFSAADIGLAYICSLAERLEMLGPYPPLVAYLQRVRARPAFRRALERSGG